MWNESTANSRMNAFKKKGVHGGTLMLSRHTTHEQKIPPEASMSQANQFANNTHEEFMFNSRVAEEGVNSLQMHNLQEWKDGAETDLKLELKQYCNEVEYKLTNRMILEIKEFAKFKKEIYARLRTVETENAQLKGEIKRLRQVVQAPTPKTAQVDQTPINTSAKVQQPTPSSPNAQPSTITTSPHLQDSPRKHFREMLKVPATNITAGKPNDGNASTHIKRRQPIIENEYNAEPIDSGVALFVLSCYQHATVVNIDGHCLTAGQLLPLVKGGYIGDAVINAFVHISNVETEATSFISTFDARLLRDNMKGEERTQIRKGIANKCKGRHLVFVPMHINNNHWALLVLNFIKTEVQILNSIPTLRDINQEKALVQGIQSCIDYSVEKDLVSFAEPINLRDWEIVPYDNIPLQSDGSSCAAYIMKYILAWDGDHMAQHFTQTEVKGFKFRLGTRLLHSTDNLEFPDFKKPVTKEDYYAKSPAEKVHPDDMQISPEASTKETPASSGGAKEKTVSAPVIMKRPRGRPRKIVQEDNIASRGSAELTGAPKRKRGRPSKIDVTNTRTVVDDFSTESIADRLRQRKIPVLELD